MAPIYERWWSVANDEVVSVAEVNTLEKVKQLEQMLWRKTMEAEILRDALSKS